MEEVVSTNYFQRIGKSLGGALIGIILFFVSFAVLFINEGAQKDGEVLKDATEIPANQIVQHDGIVAVTGTITASDALQRDEDIIALGDTPALYLDRMVETYAWVEQQQSNTEERIGGGETTTTSYIYTKDWANIPQDSTTFKEQSGERVNLPPLYPSRILFSKNLTLEAYTVADSATFADPLSLTLSNEKIQRGTIVDDNYLFISRNGQTSYTTPAVGDTRITYFYFPSDTQATIAGRVQGENIVRYNRDDIDIFKIYSGDYQQALGTAQDQDKARIWFFRVLGFVLMFVGLLLFLKPISILFKIIPVAGDIVFFGLALVAFLISLILTTITIILSIIIHNPLILATVVIATLIVLLYVFRKKLTRNH